MGWDVVSLSLASGQWGISISGCWVTCSKSLLSHCFTTFPSHMEDKYFYWHRYYSIKGICLHYAISFQSQNRSSSVWLLCLTETDAQQLYFEWIELNTYENVTLENQQGKVPMWQCPYGAKQNSYDLTARFNPELNSELSPKDYAQKTILQIRSSKALTPRCLERTYKHIQEFCINSCLYLYTIIITTDCSDTFALISQVTNTVPS